MVLSGALKWSQGYFFQEVRGWSDKRGEIWREVGGWSGCRVVCTGLTPWFPQSDRHWVGRWQWSFVFLLNRCWYHQLHSEVLTITHGGCRGGWRVKCLHKHNHNHTDVYKTSGNSQKNCCQRFCHYSCSLKLCVGNLKVTDPKGRLLFLLVLLFYFFFL